MTITPEIKREYLKKIAGSGKRADGRSFDEFRKIEIETGVIVKAEGSARVKIGNSQVITGIKMEIGDPYPDTPDQGAMSTSAELIPLASPDFESGPPDKESIELARVVDRGIRESGLIDLEKLCIVSGEKVWIVFIDIHILDYDGNLFDTASLASLAALMTSNVPIDRLKTYLERLKDKYPSIEKYLKNNPKNFPIPLREPPISCTSVKYDNIVAIDPTLDEDEIAEARLTVATDKKGDIRAMQKGLNGSFTKEEIRKVIKSSIHNGNKIREQLYKKVGK